MKRKSLLAVAGLLALPVSAIAADAVPGKLSYNQGTQFEFGDEFSMKLNVEWKQRYSFIDTDGGDDVSEFQVIEGRPVLSGDLLNKQFSYKLSYEFGGYTGALQDAWAQWNADDAAHVRIGQYKQPFSRQDLVSETSFQLINRSIVSDVFAPHRHQGAMLHGNLDENATYALSMYNGTSDGEGQNAAGVDNKMAFAGQVTTSFGEYGSREVEGDIYDTANLAGTIGASVGYGEGKTLTVDPMFGDFSDSNFKNTIANVDLGLRYAGLSLQSEYYYNSFDPEASSSSVDTHGFYIQSGYFFVPKTWEIAGRFGLINPDKTAGFDDIYEYSGVVNYYINGHALKVQTGVTAVETNYSSESGVEDTTDVAYQVQLVGLL